MSETGLRPGHPQKFPAVADLTSRAGHEEEELSMDNLLVRDYNDLSMEERVRAIKTTEHLAGILVDRDIGRAEQEGDIGTVYLHPRQCIMMLAQEIGAEDAPEIQALLRREEEELRLDPRVITMQEVWAEEKLTQMSRSWALCPEPDNSKLSKEQLRVARSLAHLYGHNWAWAMTGRPPHEYGKVVKSVKRPRATTVDIYRHTVDLLGEDGYGLNLPINSPKVVEGNVVHQTGTGRLTWLIRPDGSVQLTVSRPAGWVLRAELGTTRPRKVVVVRNPAVPLHRRHIEALERPIKRLAPRWTVPAALEMMEPNAGMRHAIRYALSAIDEHLAGVRIDWHDVQVVLKRAIGEPEEYSM